MGNYNPNTQLQQKMPSTKEEPSSFLSTQATKNVQRALKSQGGEWFQFLSHRIIGWSIAFFVFTHPVYFASLYRDELNELFKDKTKSTLVMTFFVNTQWVLIVCLFELIYALKSPFFEKWKANEEPWP